MSPAEQAAEVYEREDCPRTFARDVELHMLNGYVFSTPHFFAMGRPVNSMCPAWQIVDPAVRFERGCDAWLVYLVAGDMRRALACFPYRLPLVGFERFNVLRWHPMDKLIARIALAKASESA